LAFNKWEVIENGAFRGLVNLQELHFFSREQTMKSFDLAVLGNEPDLANLRFLNLYDFGKKTFDSIVSSVDLSKLFAHCRHRVVVQADRNILQASGASQLFNGLLQSGRISLCFTKPW
jgi:hypothetical protein